MLSCQRGERGTKGADFPGAQAGRTSSSGTNDAKSWWEEEVSSVSSAGPQHHLRNWKVMLWLLSSLLALADGAIPGQGRRAEPGPMVERVPEEVGWNPASFPEVEELGEGDSIPSWDGFYENPSLSEEVEDHQVRWARSPSKSGTPKNQRTNRKKSKDCRIQKKEVRVRDLGLGFDSDEIVLFKYCVGTCEDSRKTYDLVLNDLMKNGRISGKRVSPRPCCRPTRYETVTFMDTKTAWKTIDFFSAANCSCVG